jgi:type I restriction enzyme S subunit
MIAYQRLDEVADTINGLWKGENEPLQLINVIRNTNFSANGVLSFDDVASIEVETKKYAKRKLIKGDIILEKSGGGPKQPVGRVAYFDLDNGDYSFSNFTSAIRVKDNKNLNPAYLHKYLHYIYISGYTEQIQTNSTGIRNLNFDAYKAIKVPLPPLPEQQRIVAILDEAFAGLDKAMANTERNLANAREVFERFLDEIFLGNSKNFDTGKLSQICLIGDGNHSSKYPKSSEMVDVGVPFIRSTNLVDGELSSDDLKFISPEKHKELKKGHLKTGDVLFTNRGEIGKLAIVTPEFDGANLNSQIAWLRCLDSILPEYLFFFLQSAHMKHHYSQTQSGTALQQFTISMLEKIEVTFPSIEIQKTICSKLVELNSNRKDLEVLYRRKSKEIQNLKQSLLRQAFAGELK